MKRTILASLAVAGLLPLSVWAAVGTSFTYQGRIKDGSSWANGEYDFQFKLYDAASNGSQQGSTNSLDNLQVTDGFLTVSLDFGSVWTSDQRWLQTEVRPGSSTGAYTTLTPRQELKPIPYAIFATNGGSGGGSGGWTDNGTSVYVTQSSRKVGIGTASPTVALQVGSNYGIERIGNGKAQIIWDTAEASPRIEISQCVSDVSGTGGPAGPGVLFSTGQAFIYHGAGIGWADVYSQKTLSFWTADGTKLVERMRLTSGGDLGLGTTTPAQKLDVIGNVRCVDVIETSDERLKTDVTSLSNVLAKLDQVRAVTFRWNDQAQSLGGNAGQRQIGVLAQELEQVFPELVTTPDVTLLAKQLSEEKHDPQVRQAMETDLQKAQYKGVSYSKLTAVLLEAVKELKAENELLKQRVATLEQKVK